MGDNRKGDKSLLGHYLKEINQHELLTREEERELGRRIQEENDQEAIHKLTVCNLRLVVKMARDYSVFHGIFRGDLLELIQEGNTGLLYAVKKFDPKKRVKFSYYASFWIKAFILRFFLDKARLIRVATTPNTRMLFFQLEREIAALLSKNIVPSSELIAEKLGVKKEEVVLMRKYFSDKEVRLESNTFGDKSLNAENLLSLLQTKATLGGLLSDFRKNLKKRELDILDNRIMAEKPATLQVISERHGLSRERIRQVQRKIIREIEVLLRKKISNPSEFFEDFL